MVFMGHNPQECLGTEKRPAFKPLENHHGNKRKIKMDGWKISMFKRNISMAGWNVSIF